MVADEVHALANRAAEVTLNIDEVISSMKKQTNQVQTEISQSEQSIEKGVILIEDIIEALQNMRHGAQQSLQSMQSLTELTIQQAQESDTVATNTSEILEIAHKNEEASNELLISAQRVEQVLATFQLKSLN